MITFLVIWKVSFSTPCSEPPPDPYGREINQTTLQLCYRQEIHQKEFKNRKEAEQFFNDAPDDWHIQDMEIEEVEQ